MRPIIRVFPRRTKWTPSDPLSFSCYPPLFRPEGEKVLVSVAFTWDISEGKRLARAWGEFYPDVKLGGPANGPGQPLIEEGVKMTNYIEEILMVAAMAAAILQRLGWSKEAGIATVLIKAIEETSVRHDNTKDLADMAIQQIKTTNFEEAIQTLEGIKKGAKIKQVVRQKSIIAGNAGAVSKKVRKITDSRSRNPEP